MPLIDYKITPAERTAAYVQSQPDTVIGTPALGKQIYDEYPDLIRDNHDGLCDYIATMPIAYLSSAAAATAAKGSITGFVPLGGIVELSMTNGNTAVSPTVSIDGVTHTISGMPTTAQVQANSVQTYRLAKTGATVLTFTKNPDYVCEYGTNSNSFLYTVYASGRYNYGTTYTPTVTAGSGTITTVGADAKYVVVGNQVTFSFNISITTAGTGAGALLITTPFTIASDSYGMAKELSLSGIACTATSGTANQKIGITKYDNTTVIANGAFVRGTVTFFI